MDAKPLISAVLFFAFYPFKMVYGTVKGILNTVLMYAARLLRLDKLVSKMSGSMIRRSDRFFSRSGNPLLRGDLLAYAEQEYPRDLYPTAWEDIPDDVQRLGRRRVSHAPDQGLHCVDEQGVCHPHHQDGDWT